MRNKILEILEFKGDFYNSRRLSESFFIKNHPDLYKNIKDKSTMFNSFIETLYNIVFMLNEKPKCESCNNEVRFRKFSEGYSKYCSMKCIALDESVKSKRKKTNLSRHGVNYPAQNKEIKTKTIATNLERYGVEHPSQNKEIKTKTIATNLERYGVEHHLKLESQINKQKKTFLKNYGVNNPQKNPSIKKKTIITNLEKYGVEHPSQNEEVKAKTITTNLEKYGVETVFQNKEIKAKTITTNLEKYGVEHPSQNEEVRKKIIKGNNYNILKGIEYWKDILKINNIIISDDNEYIIGDYCSKHIFSINKSLLKNRFRLNITDLCTICNPISENVSIKEKELKEFIKNDLNLNFIENNRTILNGKELDIYLPDHNLAIEFNGLYYHSDCFKENNYHLKKTDECQSNNIQLIHIFEDEWIYKSDIVKSIIKSKLGLNSNKIYGRKTEVKEITSKESKDFLDYNHIQGNVNSSIRLGLYYEDELVSVMTFGKKRVSMGGKSEEGHYEMYRFSNKLNTSVMGGANKLFKYFINNYLPKEVISYADRRYFDGSIYNKLGFSLDGVIKPNYWYFKRGNLIRYHRFKFRKDILIREGFDKNKTEKEIMIERDYYRIYDSGNLKYKWNNE